MYKKMVDGSKETKGSLTWQPCSVSQLASEWSKTRKWVWHNRRETTWKTSTCFSSFVIDIGFLIWWRTSLAISGHWPHSDLNLMATWPVRPRLLSALVLVAWYSKMMNSRQWRFPYSRTPGVNHHSTSFRYNFTTLTRILHMWHLCSWRPFDDLLDFRTSVSACIISCPFNPPYTHLCIISPISGPGLCLTVFHPFCIFSHSVSGIDLRVVSANFIHWLSTLR